MKAQEIFIAALEQYPPDQWEAFLRESCSHDEALRQRVSALLAAHLQSNPLLDGTSVVDLKSLRLLEHPGARIGPYRLLEEIGEGGFGIIFLAEQTEPVHRKIALKVLKPGLDSRSVMARFEAERQALAMMEHPGIARVFDGGLTPAGRPYFVMELVRGLPITEYCDQQRLSLRDRLEMFVKVCHAVQHAHLKGVIHRDLKPSNVMVTECDGQSFVKIIDFGIAKAIGNVQLTDKTLHTGHLHFLGTPSYMSPEQAALSAVDVDTRSDVYSLGILLYELLTGAPPLTPELLRSLDYDEMRRTIREYAPPRPSVCMSTSKSQALATITANRQLTLSGIRSQLRAELDWVVMKCLEKDRSRRYQSVAALTADIQAFLADEPVTACPPSIGYRVAKLARKHRLFLVTAGIVWATLITALTVSVWQAKEAWKAHYWEKQARTEVARQKANLQQELFAADMSDAWQAWRDGEIERAQAYLQRFIPEAGEVDPREFSWRYLQARCQYVRTLLGSHEKPILTAVLSPDGHLLASSDRLGTVKIWNLSTRTLVTSWNYSEQEVNSLAFSPDGSILATAGQDRAIRLWSTRDWQELGKLEGHTRTVMSMSWSPDGSRLVSGGRDSSIRIWDVAGRREETCLSDLADVVRCVVWLRDGQRIVAAVGKSVSMWQTDSWQPAGNLTVHAKGVLSLAESPDGRLLASGGYDSVVVVCDLLSNRERMRTQAVSTIWSLRFSADGRQLYAGVETGGPSAWHVRESEHRLEYARVGVERSVVQRAVLLDPKEQTVITATEINAQIHLTAAAEVLGYSYLEFPEDCLAVSLSQDLAVCGATDGSVAMRRFSTKELVATLRGHSAPVLQAAISCSGRWLATRSADQEIRLWSVADQQLHGRLQATGAFESGEGQIMFSPDEKFLGVSSSPGPVHIWRVEDGLLWRTVHATTSHATRLAFSPSGDCFATTVGYDGGTVWTTATGRKLASFGRGVKCTDLLFINDASRIMAAADVNGILAWDLSNGHEAQRLGGHRGQVTLIALSPDRRTLASVASDDVIRLWHLPTGRELFAPLHHTESLVYWIAFASPTQLLIGARLSAISPVGVFTLDAGPSSTKLDLLNSSGVSTDSPPTN